MNFRITKNGVAITSTQTPIVDFKFLLLQLTVLLGANYIIQNFSNLIDHESKWYYFNRLDEKEHIYDKINWIECDMVDSAIT